MIGNQTDTKQRYLCAIKDINAIMAGPCPLTLVGFLANEGVQLTLKKWINPADIPGDIRADFNAILHGLDKAIEAFPACPELTWARAMRGRALAALGYYRACFEDFDYAIERNPTSATICTLVAEACLAHAENTLNDSMCLLMAASHYLDSAVVMEPKTPRQRVARAVCTARTMQACGYYRHTEIFRVRYKAILADLDAARRHCHAGDLMKISALEKQLFSMLTQ